MSTPTPWDCFSADLARYPRRAWLSERSVWAIAVFRLGQQLFGPPASIASCHSPTAPSDADDGADSHEY